MISLSLRPLSLGLDFQSVVVVIFVSLPTVVWLSAFSLLAGFWFDMMTHKLNKTLAKRTRVVCIIGACLLMIVVPGLIFNVLDRSGMDTGLLGILVIIFSFDFLFLQPLFRALIFVFGPIIVVVLGLISVTIIAGCQPDKDMGRKNRQKKAYVFDPVFLSCLITGPSFVAGRLRSLGSLYL